MGQIVRGANGSYRCNGHYCGYPLAWFPCEPAEGAEGEWVCLDCYAAIYAGRPRSEDEAA